MAKFLRKITDGRIFGYTEALAKRADMVPCDGPDSPPKRSRKKPSIVVKPDAIENEE